MHKNIRCRLAILSLVGPPATENAAGSSDGQESGSAKGAMMLSTLTVRLSAGNEIALSRDREITLCP